jgi:phospholipase C
MDNNMRRTGRTESSSFQTSKAKTIVKNRLKFVVGITVSLFLVAALVAASIILPLAYAQQITSINNPATNPINHIVVIMQENRSFDNYFGTTTGTCMPLSPDHPNVGCVKPFLSTNVISGDLPHVYQSSVIAHDNGKMDGFMVADCHIMTTRQYHTIGI